MLFVFEVEVVIYFNNKVFIPSPFFPSFYCPRVFEVFRAPKIEHFLMLVILNSSKHRRLYSLSLFSMLWAKYIVKIGWPLTALP